LVKLAFGHHKHGLATAAAAADKQAPKRQQQQQTQNKGLVNPSWRVMQV
jgi:hypothetical protein